MTDWSRRAVVAIFVGLTLLFFWRPLSGQWSLLPNDLLDNAAPWSSERTPGRAENPWLSDTIDVHSHFVALSKDARSGDLSWWDRSLTGGIPSLKAGLSPLLLPYLLLPAAYAPGVVAALRVLVAGGFLARLRRGSAPTVLQHSWGCRLRLHWVPRRVGLLASIERRRIRTRLVVVGRVAGVGTTTASRRARRRSDCGALPLELSTRRDLCRDRRRALRRRPTHCIARRPPAPPRRAVGAAADDLGSGRRCARHGCDLDLPLGVHDLPRRQRHELPGRQTGRLQHRHPLSVDPRAPVGIRLSPPDAGVLGRRYELDRGPGLCGRIGPAPGPPCSCVPAWSRETLQQRFASCRSPPSSACGFRTWAAR